MSRLTQCSKTSEKTIATAVAAILFLALPRLAAACSVCFGAADAPMVHGQNSGILALLAVVGVVQVGVVKVVWDFRRRAKRLPPPPTAAPARRLRLIHGGKH